MQNARSSYLGKLIIDVGTVVKEAIPLAAALALLFFFWGLATTILRSGNEEAVKEGKNRMKWGIVALFVMVAVWGIVTLIGVMLGVSPWLMQQGVDNPPTNAFQASV